MTKRALSIDKRWQQFLCGIGIIICLIWGLVPILTSFSKGKEMKEFIEKNDIDTNALFYTESVKAGEVEFYIKKTQRLVQD